jgi:hypothetical protein
MPSGEKLVNLFIKKKSVEMDQVPFSKDPECLALAIRIVKEGLPDFSPAQLKAMRDKQIWAELQQCRRNPNGVDFGCVCQKMFPAEMEKLDRCWKRFKNKDICERQIFRACEKMQETWSQLLFSVEPKT